MSIIAKPKKSSFIISFLDLILVLYFAFSFFAFLSLTDTFDFSLVQQGISDYFKTLDYKTLTAYLHLISFGLPVLGALLGLFGKIWRFGNIASFGADMFCLAYWVVFQANRGVSLLNFNALNEIFLSTGILCLLLASILSLINLCKSK